MQGANKIVAQPKGEEGVVFDRDHLFHYAMQDRQLAAEVVSLFLIQLPAMLRALEVAATAADWAFATHTLKGSAAAVGAASLQRLAAEMEGMSFPGDGNLRLLRLQAAKGAAAAFATAARQAFPEQG